MCRRGDGYGDLNLKSTCRLCRRSRRRVVVEVVVRSKSKSKSRSIGEATVDAVQLSIFNNRFMGIAEQMGRTLQRTSVSTNIKERLDFGCACLDPTVVWWPTPPTSPYTWAP